MARVLHAWEFGAHSGHLAHLAPVADCLARRRHRMLAAVQDVREAAARLGEGMELAAAPAAPFPRGSYPQPASYAEMLALRGYADARTLERLVSGWLELIRSFDAEALIIDYAPTAALAARVAGLPCVRLDTGFTRPPSTEPLSSMLPWKPVAPERLARSEARVLDCVNAVLKGFGAPPAERLAELLQAESSFLLTFAEIDAYEGREGERYDGPYFLQGMGEARQWPAGGARRVLAYLRPGPALEPALDAIVAAGAKGLCCVPGASAELVARYRSQGVDVTTGPLRLDSVLPDADVALGYGSLGFVCAALQAGVPCVILPADVEKALLARRVVQMGAGLALGSARVREELPAALASVLEAPRFRAAAQSYAERHRSHRPQHLLERVAAEVERVV